MSREQVKKVGWWVLAIALLCVILWMTGGCSGQRTTVKDYIGRSDGMSRLIILDTYLTGRDHETTTAELYLAIDPNDAMVYWMILNGVEGTVSPENAKIIGAAARAAAGF